MDRISENFAENIYSTRRLSQYIKSNISNVTRAPLCDASKLPRRRRASNCDGAGDIRLPRSAGAYDRQIETEEVLSGFSYRRGAPRLISPAARRDTINEMINTNTRTIMPRGRGVTPRRDTDESAEVKVRRMSVHLKGQGKMQVSNEKRREREREKKKLRVSGTVSRANSSVHRLYSLVSKVPRECIRLSRGRRFLDAAAATISTIAP